MVVRGKPAVRFRERAAIKRAQRDLYKNAMPISCFSPPPALTQNVFHSPVPICATSKLSDTPANVST